MSCSAVTAGQHTSQRCAHIHTRVPHGRGASIHTGVFACMHAQTAPHTHAYFTQVHRRADTYMCARTCAEVRTHRLARCSHVQRCAYTLAEATCAHMCRGVRTHYIHVCSHMRTYIYMCLHAHITYTFAHTCACTCTHMCHTCMYIYVRRTYAPELCEHIIFVCSQMCTEVCAYTHTHMHTEAQEAARREQEEGQEDLQSREHRKG